MTSKRQHLIVDADDTLWENNIYFERAFDDFVVYLDHSSLSPREIRDVLDAIEAVNAKTHGYGSLNFGRNLRETYERLCEREIGETDMCAVMGFGPSASSGVPPLKSSREWKRPSNISRRATI